MQNVVVPLNAFDRFEVLEKGQAAFIETISLSGAAGVEIRRELTTGRARELEDIQSEINKYKLFTVYSAPIELWKQDHHLNEAELTEVFQEGLALGADWIKVSLGHFEQEQSNIAELALFVKQHKTQLLVENDQTPHGGNINRLAAFFESAKAAGVPVKMTFDAGNWYYSGQDVEEALQKLAPYVSYLHLKQVEQGPITVPLEKTGNTSWIKVNQQFPSSIMKALEFPIEPKERMKEYISLINEVTIESGALS